MTGTPGRMPNVLLVLTDQQKRATCAAYGNPQIGTPAMDGFAARAAVFENAICPQPVCTPSRAALFSGVYPHTNGCIRNGIRLPFRFPTLAERLRDHGMRTGYIGKWHLGNEVLPQRGFEEFWAAVDDNYTSKQDYPLYGPSAYLRHLVSLGLVPPERIAPGAPRFEREEIGHLPEEHSKAAFVAREACRFLEARRDDPFFLVCGFLEPHPPFHGPYDEWFDRAQISLPPNFCRTPRPGWSRRHRAYQTFPSRPHGNEPPKTDAAAWRDVIARYFGMVKLYDEYLGVILDRLEALGLADNTIVILASDHGDMMGEQGMLHKGAMFEGCLGIPLMIRTPGCRAGRRIRQAANLIDLGPTLFDLLGLPVPPEFHGTSLGPLLREEIPEDPETPAFAEWNGLLQHMYAKLPEFQDCLHDHVRVVRDARHKLILTPGDVTEFYDLEEDPWETENRAGQARYAAVTRRLLAALSTWQKRTGDPLGESLARHAVSL